MPTTKRPKPTPVRDVAIASLRRMPADSTYEDLQYQLYVLAKVRKGEAALSEQAPVSQAAARRRMQRWLVK